MVTFLAINPLTGRAAVGLGISEEMVSAMKAGRILDLVGPEVDRGLCEVKRILFWGETQDDIPKPFRRGAPDDCILKIYTSRGLDDPLKEITPGESHP